MRKRALLVVAAMLAALLNLAAPASAAGPDCSVPGDYATIQAAINDVGCQTISVGPGVYNENLSIARKLTLAGSGSGSSAADTIVVSGASSIPVIDLTAGGASASDRLVISDLRLTGASGTGGNADSGVQMRAGANNFITFDNVAAVANSGNGIAISMGAGSTVTDVEVLDSDLSDNGNAGFRVPTRVTVNGLVVSGSHLDRNKSIGFTMFGSLLNASIDGSTFNGNGGTPAANAGTGISMHGSDSMVNTVTNLTISNSQANGNAGTHPANNVSTGIQFSSREGDVFSGIIIRDSALKDNARHGLRLEVVGTGVLDGVTVEGSQITGNAQIGVTPFSSVPATNVILNRNNISGNGAGIVNMTSSTYLAECNWWGDASGPGGVGSGLGDAVSPNVDFTPFLLSSDLTGACSETPVLTPDDASVTVDEGQLATNSGTYSAGSQAALVISASVGTAGQSGTPTGGTWNWSYTPDDGPADSATVTMAGDNGSIGTETFSLTVNNVAPTATFNAPATAIVGNPFTVSLTGGADPSTADTAAGFSYAFDCGTGYQAFGGSPSATCVISSTGTHNLGGRIRDKDLGARPYGASISVRKLTANDCKNGGWQSVLDAQGKPFKNQGTCVSYTSTGKNA